MARPPIDLVRKIKDILKHVEPLPDESRAPILHYRRTGADIWSSLAYIERSVDQGERYRRVVDRHLGRLYGMALVNLIETFERFLKEIAATCVDCVADFVVDDRLNEFKHIQGSNLASHFRTATLGKSLCESSIWLDCKEINDRFGKLLSDPFQIGGQTFQLFSKQTSPGKMAPFHVMNLIWQIRNTSVHNVGVITQSDAVKLRLLAKEPVEAPRLLSPTRADLNYLKRYLDETADECNRQVGKRLAELLTTFHSDTPHMIDPLHWANIVSTLFQQQLQVAGMTGMISTS